MKPNSRERPFVTNTQALRRQFLKAAMVGGSGAILASTSWLRGTLAAGHADVLLLTCMDYRLEDATERYMASRGLKNKFDHVVLAGAALGAITDKYPEWNKTFWDELALAINLHHVHEVMVLDHRDCGAYKEIFGEDFAREPKKEFEVHAVQLKKLREMIKEKYAQLEVELLLMDLAGKVEKI
jgi:carbonic anhydrase